MFAIRTLERLRAVDVLLGIAVLGGSTAFAAAGTNAQPPPAAAPPTFSVLLRPTGTAGSLDHLEVESTLSGIDAGPDRPFLSVPAQFANLRAQVYRDGDVQAEDAAGPLPLTMAEQSPVPGNPVQFRLFTAQRTTRGPIRFRYRATVTPTSAPRTLGPSYDLRGMEGGFTGGGASFLILPADQARRYRFELDWDLSRLPVGAVGVSTLGAGRVAVEDTPGRLMTAFFMGGTVHRFPENAGNLPFNAFWIGEPVFDAPATMRWTTQSFEILARFFRDPDLRSYYLFGRPNPNPTIGGAATNSGFMVEYGANARDPLALRQMFTHEMIHHFTGSIDGIPMATSWYHEGLAELYKIRLPFRAGLIGFDDYAASVRNQVAAYYRNPSNRLPNRQIPERFWLDRSVQNLPYARGFIYFADLDARVRIRSRGRRSLDDLLLAMLASRRAGQGYDETTWRRLVRAELGTRAIRDFDQMLAGEIIEPHPAAFGPCLVRQPSTTPTRALGFADPSLQRERIVTNLEPGSAAAAAGLREGDRIRRIEGWARGSDDDASAATIVTVEVEREGEVIPIRFDSARGHLRSYSWAPRPGANGRSCAL